MTNDEPVDKPLLPPAEESNMPTSDLPIDTAITITTFQLPSEDEYKNLLAQNFLMADEMLGFIDGYPASVLLQMSDEEIAKLGNPNVINAVNAAKLILTGQQNKAGELLNTVPDVETVKNFVGRLLDGRYPLRPRDFARISLEDLRSLPDITPLQIQGAELAQRWLERDRIGVLWACDNAELAGVVSQILADDVPEEVGIFSRMIEYRNKSPLFAVRAPVMVEGYSQDVLLQMSDAEIAALSNQNLAKAVEAAKLALDGGASHDVVRILEGAPEKQFAQEYAILVLDGKFPIYLRDTLRFSPEQLRNFPRIETWQVESAEVAQLWLAGDKEEVSYICDSIQRITDVANMLRDLSPEEGDAFDKVMQPKIKALTPTPEFCVDLWMVGQKLKAWRAAIMADIFDEFFTLLELTDPEHSTGSVSEFLNSSNFAEMAAVEPRLPDVW